MNSPTSSLLEITDITIIGGGMVGLTLALMLAQELPTRQIVLIEKNHSLPLVNASQRYQPSFDARSTAISAGSVDVFKHLGIWTHLAQHATEITEVHVSDKGHLGRTRYQKKSSRHTGLGYVLENAWLGRQLLNAVCNCNNIQIIDEATVKTLNFGVNCAEIQIKQNQNLRYLQSQLAILADGANSPLANNLGIQTTNHNYQQYAIIANVQFEKSHDGRAFERFTKEGPMALLPLGESANAKTSALVWTQPSDKVSAAMALSDVDFLSQIQNAFGFKLGYFTAVSPRHNYQLALQQATEQVRNSLVLMGNAAHFLHPVAGQGFNLALRDCAALSGELKQAESTGSAIGSLTTLLKYQAAQAKDQLLTTQISHQFNRIFSNQNLAVQAGRNLGLLTLDLIKPAKHQFFQQMMGLGGKRYL